MSNRYKHTHTDGWVDGWLVGEDRWTLIDSGMLKGKCGKSAKVGKSLFWNHHGKD